MIKLNKIFIIIFFISVSVSYFVTSILGKTVITGDKMEVKDRGAVVVLEGNSKVVKDEETIMSDNMIYTKKESAVSASGNVVMSSKTKDNELFDVRGNFADYNMKNGSGKLWGNIVLKYFTRDSAKPIVLGSQELYIDKNQKIFEAYDSVQVVTSDGKVYSDNVIFFQEKRCIVFKKDKKRPIAVILREGEKGVYEADNIFFYNFDKNKKVIMNGSILARIKIEDKKVEDKDKKTEDKKTNDAKN